MNRGLVLGLCISVAAALLGGCGATHMTIAPLTSSSATMTRGRNTESVTYQSLYSFKGSPDAHEPVANLVVVSGKVYGVTDLGGDQKCYGAAYGCGTVFTITEQGVEHVLYRFHPPGALYPVGITKVRDLLYGTSSGGGSGHCGAGSLSGCGTVFKLTTTGEEHTVYSFKGNGDGQQPLAPPTYFKSKLYGTTGRGGSHTFGTVFSLELSGKERILHSFGGGSDGSFPLGQLISVGGQLYGTTVSGGGSKWCIHVIGQDGCGTVFSITPSGTQRIIYRFQGNRDGAAPEGVLVNVNGSLYGTTFNGGAGTYCTGRCGTVFEVDPSSGKERVVYSFQGGADGYEPASGLLSYRGVLFGLTPYGGTGNQGPCSVSGYGHCGTIYQLSESGAEQILYNFQGPPDGNRPIGSGLVEMNGAIYGTTALGGSHCKPALGCGTVFSFRP